MLDVSIFTRNGVSLLSAASATKTIDIDAIYCMESELSESDIANQPPEYFAVRASSKLVGRVVSAGDDPNNPGRSRVVIAIGLSDSVYEDVTVKSVVVTAHSVDAGVDGETGTFFGMSDHVGLVITYSATIPMTQRLSFSFAFTENSSISVDGDLTNYLMESEVNRFVTTHKAGEPSQGDDQTIKGEKTFDEGIKTNDLSGIGASSITVHSEILTSSIYNGIGDSTTPFARVYAVTGYMNSMESITGGVVSCRSDIRPNTTGTYSLGSDIRQWLNTYTQKLYVNDIIPGSGSIGDSTHLFSEIYATGLRSNSIQAVSPGLSIMLCSDMIPDSDNTRRLGMVGATWKSGDFNTIRSNTASINQLTTSLVVPTTGVNAVIGTLSTPFTYIYANKINATKVYCPDANSSGSANCELGDANHRWMCVYCGYAEIKQSLCLDNISCDILTGYTSTKKTSAGNIGIVKTNAAGFMEILPLNAVGYEGSLGDGKHVENIELSRKAYQDKVLIPIGGIVQAMPSAGWIQANNTPSSGQYEVTVLAGSLLEVDQTTAKLWYAAALRPTQADGSYFYNGSYNRPLESGTYRTLTTIEVPANFTGSFTLPVLLQRIG